MDSIDDNAHVHRVLRTDVPAPGEVMPPVLDLTAATGPLWAAATDDYDDAVVAAVLAAPGTSALWRSWRFAADATDGPGTRVYLLEAEEPEVAAAAVRSALAEAGPDTTLLIEFATGDLVPPAAHAALGASALLWAFDADEPVQVARVFDGVDPYAGPYFDQGHPRLEGPERDAALGFLESGQTLLLTPQTQDDVVDPQRGPVVPTNFRTDGAWVWTDAVAYYLREHGIAPDEGLLRHARDAGFVAAEAGAVGLHRALSCLFLPRNVEPAEEVGAG
ncbi:hypothetical protein [Micromonospora sp. DT63]|uniref:hypothetical protein n=1 Tax=Micromonospora sp. DT63 TaxID=3393441 RepID=UPI003CFAC33E